MRMKALDSFYSSETRQLKAGQEFEVDSDERAADFEKRGLAQRVEATSSNAQGDKVRLDDADAAAKLAEAGKAQAAHPNKAAAGPPNKADAKAKSKGDK